MKKYKKNPTKLLQIRLAKKEYDEALEFIKRFGVTKREWIMAVVNELGEAQVLRDNQFWTSHQSYAYANIRERIPLSPEDTCEICGKIADVRHHHDGYDGDNAFKVHKLCNSCHGKIHWYKNDGYDFEESKRRLLKFRECTHPKYRDMTRKDGRYSNERICEDCEGNISSLYLVRK